MEQGKERLLVVLHSSPERCACQAGSPEPRAYQAGSISELHPGPQEDFYLLNDILCSADPGGFDDSSGLLWRDIMNLDKETLLFRAQDQLFVILDNAFLF